jgi:tetratricopeptide (TPR) repeat protein
MKVTGLAFAILLALQSGFAQERRPVSPTKPAALLSGMGNLHHPVSTQSPEAQRFFDQGVTLIYAFNHDEAVRSFRRAAELDPKSPMPYWGIGLALGPNINLDVDPEHEKAAYEATQKAIALASNAPDNERAYVEALANRYSIKPGADLKKLSVDYKNAMRELASRFSNDLDAAALYAESLMDLHPWALWTLDGKPTEDTEEILSVLEGVMRRNPNHVGANHYYIHTVEASPHPERALPSAHRLRTLVPGAGHLVHMPGHIYIRTGDYEGAARSNEAAIKADQEYFRQVGGRPEFYSVMYYAHNLHFLVAARSMEGSYSKALRAAEELVSTVSEAVKEMPMGEFYLPTPYFVQLRFGRWDEMLKTKPPDSRWAMTTMFWHFARGVALAGNSDLEGAKRERTAVAAAQRTIPPNAIFGAYFNESHKFVELAGHILDARIAAAEHKYDAAIEHWKQAVAVQDTLYYGEPPEWYYPVRESLGGELLRAGQFQEAEQVFREDLKRNPGNGRSLFGLWECLKQQEKFSEAARVQREFDEAWKYSEMALDPADL